MGLLITNEVLWILFQGSDVRWEVVNLYSLFVYIHG